MHRLTLVEIEVQNYTKRDYLCGPSLSRRECFGKTTSTMSEKASLNSTFCW